MPDQWRAMTPVELVMMVEGFAWRQEQEQWRIAMIVAAVYDVNRNPKKRRKPITAETVMGQKHASRKPARTVEEQHERMMEFMRRSGGRVKHRES